MQTRTYNPFTTIHTEGALLPADLLQRVLAVDPKLDGLSAADYHLPAGEKPNEAINRSWNRLQGSWAAFRAMRERLGIGDFATGETRDRWLLPLFQELGYGRLQTAKAVELDGKSYPISHRWSETPIHLVGCGIKLDQRTAGAAGASRSSPHSLLQELLNRSPELLWGMVSNGLRLRVLRDNASLTRQAFLEFDLESMFEGEVYSDFAVLWLVCHQSRVESREQRGENCWLEAWSKVAQEQGLRALESLRQGVEGAIAALGSGFLRAPANQTLRLDLRSGALGTQQYYRQLLRLVYRLIFLFVAEDRDLLFDPHSSPEARERYLRHYSLARMRHMAERSRGGRHPDLYAALRLVTDILGGRKDSVSGKTGLGLPVLGGFLFSRQALPDLESAEQGRTHRVVDYKNLGARELGSVYESLLELHPLVNTDAATFELTAVSGSERKTTGSFFTPEELISLLLDSALNPVIAQALARAGSLIEKQIAALLNLRICDPACGSGHFLLAAARKLARLLAQLRTGEGEPAPEAMRAALREVISNCIYGVDINPMSVELCKVSLWMEALEPGKPLSFLDAHIQCGDSLVGVSSNLDISEIPDEAFNPAFGDDKATAAALKKRNKRERGGSHSDPAGQLGFRFEGTHMTSMEDLARWLAERAAQVDAMPEDDSTQVQAKAKAFDDYHATREYLKNRFELDLWTAAFFWKIPKADAETMLAPTQQELIQLRNGGEVDARLVEGVKELSERLNFFHWELAFPKVFSGENPGFDCALGNPPWEMLQLEEQEFFATRDPEIINLPVEQRKKAISQLVKTNPLLAEEFQTVKHHADALNIFLRESKRFPLTAVGRMNTYVLFAEHFRKILSNEGQLGVILPIGIVTDDTPKLFFSDVVSNGALVKIIGFENEAFIFPAVHHSFKFCVLVMAGTDITVDEFDAAFFCKYFDHVKEPER
ncbi:MAG: N-6 DNA methylase, partial [Candidatus Wolfebacteria bacterium]|nr:N-6 DNA methylase [Candidatus Wolfebacteria bacterium]